MVGVVGGAPDQGDHARHGEDQPPIFKCTSTVLTQFEPIVKKPSSVCPSDNSLDSLFKSSKYDTTLVQLKR